MAITQFPQKNRIEWDSRDPIPNILKVDITPKTTHSICAKYVKCQIFDTFSTLNIKKHLTADVLYVPNRKNNILFNFSLSSQFFIWFFHSLLRICLSPKFPTCVLPPLIIGHKQEAHLRRRRRRRRQRWIHRMEQRSWRMGLRHFWFLISLFSLIYWVVGSQLYDDGD